MKKIILLLALFASVSFIERTNAQVSFHVNIASQPMWGPVGYDYVQYYYLPDIEVYYNVSSHKYVYMEHNHWVSRTYLPQRYRNYDVYHSRRVVVNQNKPYLNHHNNKVRYANWQDNSNRQNIYDSREPKYYQNKRHPNHSQYKDYKRNEQSSKKNYKQKSTENNHNKDNREGSN